MMKKSRLTLDLKNINGINVFKFVDNDQNLLQNSRVKRVFERYRSYFSDFENLVLNGKL